ncbi:MAG: lysylphosphatidylglycerol synthase transmembrane domain-containing protein [Planctomycetota bacterium]|nr:lysylphosphatidylglycerol synthase transmembrane domain-containing protein [Planctomycetota bacterium]MDA1211325.1 lysylphosphatidylglycerol synthase transmembrane domain-containing protein [Planctomycetota bacterium]
MSVPARRTLWQRFKPWMPLFGWIVGGLIIAILVYRNADDIAKLKDRQIVWSAAIGAVLLCGISLLLTFVRWWLLIWGLDFDVKLYSAVRIGFVGYLSNYVGPGSAGGDLVKAAIVAKGQTSRRAVVAATVLLDRILGLLALFIVGGLASLIPRDWHAQSSAIFTTYQFVYWGASIVGMLGLVVMMIPAITRLGWWKLLFKVPVAGNIFSELMQGIMLYQSRPRVIVACVVISLLGHVGMLSTFYLCGMSVNSANELPDLITHLQLIPAAELAGVMAIFIPGGVGVLEGAVGKSYELAGAQVASGILTGLAFRIVSVLMALPGLIYYLLFIKQMKEQTPSTE